jgi:hypothetical protein
VDDGSKRLDQLITALLNAGLVLFKLVALLAGLIIAVKLVMRLAKLSDGPRQLIIENLTDATGRENLVKALPGLSQLIRERLSEHFEYVRELQLRLGRELDPQLRNFREFPWPQEKGSEVVSDVLGSLTEVAPDPVKPALPFLQLGLRLGFTGAGTRVTGVVQRWEEKGERLAISLQVADLQNRNAPSAFTIKEIKPKDTSVAGAQEAPVINNKQHPPTYVDTIVKRVLNITEDGKEEKPPSEPSDEVLLARYRRLMRPASWWLAYELLRREFLDNPPLPLPWRTRKHYEAQVYNFVGVRYSTLAAGYGSYFNTLAEADLKRAIAADPKWRTPYENLAYLYGDLAERSLEDESGRERADYLRDSQRNYTRALSLTGRIRNQDEKREMERRIKVGQALHCLRTADPDLIKIAQSNLDDATATPWDAGDEKTAYVLYNLACCYAVALKKKIRIDDIDRDEYARRYLAYSLARNHLFDLWYHVKRDNDLDGLLGKGELRLRSLERLMEEMGKAFGRNPDLHESKRKEFVDELKVVMEKAGWLTTKGGS